MVDIAVFLLFKFFLTRLFDNVDVAQGRYDELAKTAAVFLINYEGINGNKYYSIFRIYSKIAPIAHIYDLFVEFINSKQGHIDMLVAKHQCDNKPIAKINDK